ncbi:MAG: hypothetical protein B6D34_01225 [Candidatus Brocadia sp. UTAMX1]|nr:MAG: hypothetical protein B6D34_01225 [Candidatus Brocadia sp. UTAMX1]
MIGFLYHFVVKCIFKKNRGKCVNTTRMARAIILRDIYYLNYAHTVHIPMNNVKEQRIGKSDDLSNRLQVVQCSSQNAFPL